MRHRDFWLGAFALVGTGAGLAAAVLIWALLTRPLAVAHLLASGF